MLKFMFCTFSIPLNDSIMHFKFTEVKCIHLELLIVSLKVKENINCLNTCVVGVTVSITSMAITRSYKCSTFRHSLKQPA